MTDDRYYRPSEGERNWGRRLNENFARLDREVEVRDVESNVEEYVPERGAKFRAVDTENVFIGDGDRWVESDSSGRNPSFETATVSNLVSDETPVFDLRAYGAEEGQVIDDALYDAIKAANEAGGGVVFVPNGTWYVDEKQHVRENVIVRGVGYGSHLKIPADNTSTGYMFYVSGPRSGLENLRLDANVQNRSGAGNTGAAGFYRAKNSWMDTCWVENFGNHKRPGHGFGVYLDAPDSGSYGNCENNVLRNVTFSDPEEYSQFGLRLYSDFASDKDASQFRAFVQDNSIVDCFFYGTAKSAVEIVGPATRRNTLHNCYARNANVYTAVFEIDFGASNNTISNCTVADCSSTGSQIYAYGVRGTNESEAYPERTATGNKIVNCRAKNIETKADGEFAGAVDVYKAEGTIVSGLTADSMTVPDGTHPSHSRGVKVDASDHTVITDCVFRDLSCPVPDMSAADTRIQDCTYLSAEIEPSLPTNYATRQTIDGWGVNDGNPSTGDGDWGAHGRNGVQVKDENTGTTYAYVGGEWLRTSQSSQLNAYLSDDLGDGKLRNRDRQAVGPYPGSLETPGEMRRHEGTYRPDWESSGGVAAEPGRIVLLPDGDTSIVSTRNRLLTGNYRYQFRFDGALTSGALQFHTLYEDYSNRYTVRVTRNRIELRVRRNGGDVETLVEGSWSQDTAHHTVGWDRHEDGRVELYFDGESLGTGQSAFEPTDPKTLVTLTSAADAPLWLTGVEYR